MKNLLLTLIFAFTIPIALRYPIIGVMSYIWIDLAAPQSFGSSGVLNELRWGLFAFIVTLSGVLFFETSKKRSISKISILFVVYWLVWLISTVPVMDDPNALDKFFRFSKAVFIGLIILHLVDSRERLEYLAWSLFLAVGVHAVLGAVKTIVTGGGGGEIIVGPDGTHIFDRNYFGLAMLISGSIGSYLANHSVLIGSRKIVKPLVVTILCCSFIAIIGTQSRGALLGILAIGLTTLMFFKNRFKLLLLGLSLLVLVAIFAPDAWVTRMSNIGQTENDSSALSRMSRWEIGLKIGFSNPWFGAGPMALLKIKDEVTGLFLVTHNMYVETVSEIGFIGWSLFMLILVCGLFMSLITSRRAVSSEMEWIQGASKAVFCAMLGLLTSGFFLDMAAHLMTYLPIFFATALYRISLSEREKRAQLKAAKSPAFSRSAKMGAFDAS
jgi:putative inorganic carbon (hco3(-)) transporter